MNKVDERGIRSQKRLAQHPLLSTRRVPQLLCLLCCLLASVAWAKTTEQERRIGKEAAEEVAKQFKFVKDPSLVERVEKIGKVVAQASGETDISYTFNIIDSPDVNAFSLPAGYIYLYKGLIDKVESDDELAGVIAHEIAHSAHHHVLKLLRKQKKFDLATLGLILVGATTGIDITQPALASQLISMAKMSQYSVDMEKEADRSAVQYLLKTPYSPVGVLTFMERLAREEAWSGTANIDWGIYRTHPPSAERVKALTQQLQQLGIPIDRRKVVRSMQVLVREKKVGDQVVGELVLGGQSLILVASDNDRSGVSRAEVIAKHLNTILDDHITFQDVRLGPDQKSVMVKKEIVWVILESDAKANGLSLGGTAELFKKNLQAALWKEYLQRMR